MSDWSRRDALRTVATATVAGLAGCSLRTDGGDGESAIARRVTGYDVRKARTGESAWLFTSTDGQVSQKSDRVEFHYITSTDERTALRFADVDATDRLAAFLRETDLERQSVYLFQHPVSACHTLRLVEVTRQSDSDIGADFCRDRKPADVRCDPAVTEIVGIAIRLPFAGDSVSSTGGGFGSTCDHPRVRGRSPDATEDGS